MASLLPARRVSGSILAATAALTLLVGCAGDTSGSDAGGDAGAVSGQIIWADYGGPTNESRQIAFFDGFDESTDAEVVSVSLEEAIMQKMLDGGEGDYSAVQVGAADTLGHIDNLVEVPLEVRADLVDEALQPYLIGGFYLALAQGWLTETFPDGGPEDWADFFDVDAFPGKRAWPGSPGSYDASYEIALLADGVAVDDLYPIDFERAEAKLDELREHMVFYQSYPEVQQLLSSGSAAIAVTATGQFTALQKAGHDVTIQWNEAFITPNGFVIPKAGANQEAVLALAAWMREPENQAVFIERTMYGPVNEDVFEYLPEDVAANVSNSPSHDNIVRWDEQYRTAHKTETIDRYTAWLAG